MQFLDQLTDTGSTGWCPPPSVLWHGGLPAHIPITRGERIANAVRIRLAIITEDMGTCCRLAPMAPSSTFAAALADEFTDLHTSHCNLSAAFADLEADIEEDSI